jgi:hypothetical protein
LFIGFAILPFVAAALAYVGFPIFEASARSQLGGSPASMNDSALAFAAGTFFVAVFVTAFGAVPIVTSMLRRGPVSLKQSVIGGVALGNAPFLLVVTAMLIVQIFTASPSSAGTHWYGLSGALRTITMSTLMGAALGSVFWVVALRRRQPAEHSRRE